MKKNIVRTLIVTSLLALLVLAACGPQATEEPAGDAAAEQPAGDAEPAAEESAAAPEVQGSISADVVLDPANTGGNPDADNLIGSVYETLVDPDGGLTTSWRVSDDGLTYTFNLRPDVMFHDGTQLNADAVIANFNRWFDPASELRGSSDYAAWLNYFGGFKGDVNEDAEAISLVDGIEKQDDLTVLVHLNRPDENLPSYLEVPPFAIVSPAALSAGGDGYGTAGSAIAGTGPFMVQEWSADKLVLAPHGDYWGVVPGETVEYPIQ